MLYMTGLTVSALCGGYHDVLAEFFNCGVQKSERGIRGNNWKKIGPQCVRITSALLFALGREYGAV